MKHESMLKHFYPGLALEVYNRTSSLQEVCKAAVHPETYAAEMNQVKLFQPFRPMYSHSFSLLVAVSPFQLLNFGCYVGYVARLHTSMFQRRLELGRSCISPLVNTFSRPTHPWSFMIYAHPPRFAIEPKLDGERLMIHKRGSDFKFFTRFVLALPV